jgi:hypothetical protein
VCVRFSFNAAPTHHNHSLTAGLIFWVRLNIHVLLGASPTLAPSKIAQLVKGGSSAWIHDTFPDMKAFAWQDGFGGFTVSRSNVESVADYIRGQREHHRSRTFQDEYLALLQKHGVSYDEKYLWD